MMGNGYEGVKIIDAQLLDQGQIAIRCSLIGIPVIRDELTMVSVPIIFFLPLTFLSLRSLSAVSNSFYLLLFFNSSPILSRSLYCNP